VPLITVDHSLDRFFFIFFTSCRRTTSRLKPSEKRKPKENKRANNISRASKTKAVHKTPKRELFTKDHARPISLHAPKLRNTPLPKSSRTPVRQKINIEFYIAGFAGQVLYARPVLNPGQVLYSGFPRFIASERAVSAGSTALLFSSGFPNPFAAK
jgi:hypothetical protein